MKKKKLNDGKLQFGYFTYTDNSRHLVKNEEKLNDGKLPFGGATSIPDHRT